MAICVFDIYEDGSAHVPQDDALTGPGAYRWWHFDLSDPALPGWLATHLPDIPAGALRQKETRPRCDAFEDGLILNLRAINLNEGQAADQMVSLRLWVQANVIVSVRLRRVFALDELRSEMVAGRAPSTPAAFLRELVQRLTRRIQEEVRGISERADYYETDLEDPATPPPKDLPATRRSVIKLRRYLEPQQAALNTLAGMDNDLIPLEEAHSLRETANRTTLTVEDLNALGDRIISVQDEHDLALARKQADHGYRLSVAAGVFLPLGFLTGVFGVNLAGMPGTENPLAFALMCAAMGVIALAIWIALKLAKWF